MEHHIMTPREYSDACKNKIHSIKSQVFVWYKGNAGPLWFRVYVLPVQYSLVQTFTQSYTYLHSAVGFEMTGA